MRIFAHPMQHSNANVVHGTLPVFLLWLGARGSLSADVCPTDGRSSFPQRAALPAAQEEPLSYRRTCVREKKNHTNYFIYLLQPEFALKHRPTS